MRSLLILLLMLASVAHAEGPGWPTHVCGGLNRVATGALVSLTGFGDKELQEQMEERLRTELNVRLRTAGISVTDASDTKVPGLLVLTVSLQRVFDSGYTSYRVNLELWDTVTVRRNGTIAHGLIGLSTHGGVAGSIALPDKVREATETSTNDFINCVLEARDIAGELGRQPARTPPKAPTVNAPEGVGGSRTGRKVQSVRESEQ